MNLLALAPDIQEKLLVHNYPTGCEPITEQTLRRLLGSLIWETQLAVAGKQSHRVAHLGSRGSREALVLPPLYSSGEQVKAVLRTS